MIQNVFGVGYICVILYMCAWSDVGDRIDFVTGVSIYRFIMTKLISDCGFSDDRVHY